MKKTPQGTPEELALYEVNRLAEASGVGELIVEWSTAMAKIIGKIIQFGPKVLNPDAIGVDDVIRHCKTIEDCDNTYRVLFRYAGQRGQMAQDYLLLRQRRLDALLALQKAESQSPKRPDNIKFRSTCCAFAKQQLEHRCPQHGADCPDRVLEFNPGCQEEGLKVPPRFVLVARNAAYEAIFCPACGKDLKTHCLFDK